MTLPDYFQPSNCKFRIIKQLGMIVAEAGILPLNYARTRKAMQLYEFPARGQSVPIRRNTQEALSTALTRIRIASSVAALAILMLSAIRVTKAHVATVNRTAVCS